MIYSERNPIIISYSLYLKDIPNKIYIHMKKDPSRLYLSLVETVLYLSNYDYEYKDICIAQNADLWVVLKIYFCLWAYFFYMSYIQTTISQISKKYTAY